MEIAKASLKELTKAIKDKKRGKTIEQSMKKRIQTRKLQAVEKSGSIILGVNHKGSVLEVGLIEDYYDIIKKFHNRAHVGINNTVKEVHKRRACIPRSVIQHYVQTCPTCNLKLNQVTFRKEIQL